VVVASGPAPGRSRAAREKRLSHTLYRVQPWRVNVVDGLFHRYAGFGVVMADSAEEARTVTIGFLKNDHAYGKPFEVDSVEPHESAEPYVAFFNWGDFPGGWPAATETPAPSS
jgi:hypothetical protein